MSQVEDPTRVISSNDRDWIPVAQIAPGIEKASVQVLLADEELKQVIFKFRFEPGCVLPPHTHKCHAIAYTVSGEWEYEGLKLPQGAIAYEPVESTHTPSSDKGAELVTILRSETDEFLVNHMPDGSELPLDMAFFKALEGISLEDAQKLAEAQQAS